MVLKYTSTSIDGVVTYVNKHMMKRVVLLWYERLGLEGTKM